MAVIPFPINNWESHRSTEEQVLIAMSSAGIVDLPSHIQVDGAIHRFGKNDAGWYVIHPDGVVPAGAFGHWALAIQSNFIADINRPLMPEEQEMVRLRIAEAKMKREAADAADNRRALEEVNAIWSNAAVATPDHWYLSEKKINAHGARIAGNGHLIFPIYNEKDELQSIQYVFKGQDGKTEKRYHYKTKKTAGFFVIGEITTETRKICIAEGFATGASVYEATRIPTVIAYDAGNLKHSARIFRERMPEIEIIIAADNDESGTGQTAANEAAAKYNAIVILPPNVGIDFNDMACQGIDISELFNKPKTNWLTPIDDWLSQPAPIKWVMKGWIQDNALVMIHGPSGGGKTFAALDIALHVATEKEVWHGHKVKNGPVVYLAGEGHHGLRARVAAWCQEYEETPRNMFVSHSAIDLNTPGGTMKTIQEIKSLNVVPKIIFVDTLHRFMFGDENSAEDAKTMIDACDQIKREFRCSVVLVHHTGVSETAQTRARGSSAWRGALENEISVRPEGDSIIMEATKIKDAERPEPKTLELSSVEIEGWIDEDGNQVTSAVIKVQSGAPTKEKSSKKVHEAQRSIEGAWKESGSELDKDGDPYISQAAWIRYMVDKEGKSPGTAKQYAKPKAEGKRAEILISNGIIKESENGYKILSEGLILTR